MGCVKSSHTVNSVYPVKQQEQEKQDILYKEAQGTQGIEVIKQENEASPSRLSSCEGIKKKYTKTNILEVEDNKKRIEKMSSEFSFAQSPRASNQQGQFSLKFNLKRKTEDEFCQRDQSDRALQTEEDQKSVIQPIPLIKEPLVILNEEQSIIEQTPSVCQLNSIRNSRLNLIETIRQNSREDVDLQSLRVHVQQNPKINLIALVQQRMKQPTLILDENSPSSSQIPFSPRSMNKWSEKFPIRSPIRSNFSNERSSERSPTQQDFMGGHFFDPEIKEPYQTPTSTPIIPIIEIENQPDEEINAPYSEKLMKSLKPNFRVDTSNQNSFLLQPDMSRLDLETYTLRIENMDLSYQHSIDTPQQIFEQQDQNTPKLAENMKISINNLDNRMDILPNQLLSIPGKIRPSEKESQQSRQIQTVKSMDIENHQLKAITGSQIKTQMLSSLHSPIETSLVEVSRDDEGNKKINNYIVMRELGRGGFGKVMLVYVKERNEYFAMKIANKSKLKKKLLSRVKSAYTLLEQEIAIMKKLDHVNTVKLVEVIDDPDQDKLYLVMEFLPKGAINSKSYWKLEGYTLDWDNVEDLPKIPLEKLRKYTRDFLFGLDYCNQMMKIIQKVHNFARIIHRDIKPDNLLIGEDDTLKIADFGVSHIMEGELDTEDDEITGDTGTKSFLPPEVLEGKPNIKGKAADIWATGVTFFLLSFGILPFNGKTLQQLKQKIINEEPQFPSWANPQLKDFISQCLIKDSRKRVTLEQLMEHDWPTECGNFPMLEQEFEQSGLLISDHDLQHAISKLTLRATVKITAKFKHHLKVSRQRISYRNTDNPDQLKDLKSSQDISQLTDTQKLY